MFVPVTVSVVVYETDCNSLDTLLSITVVVVVPSVFVVIIGVSPFLAYTPITTSVTVPVFDGFTSITMLSAGLMITRPGPEV